MNVDVIIVDDDAVVLFLHKILIQKCGYAATVKDFQDAAAALDFLSSHKGDHQILVLLDINMPGLSGWEFLELISGMAPARKPLVAMVTSSINSADRKKAEAYPEVVAFLEKPLSVEICKNLLSELLQK